MTFGVNNKIISGDLCVYPYTPPTSLGTVDFTDSMVANSSRCERFDDSVEDSVDEATANRTDAQAFDTNMGGKTFTPGSWHSPIIKVAASTTIILDGEGDPNAEFLFQADTEIWIGASVIFTLINGAKWENVLWAAGTAFTAGATFELYGSVMAGTKITIGAGVNVHGCLISLTAVTLGANVVVMAARPLPPTNSPSNSPSASPTTANPSHSPSSSPTVSPTATAIMTGCDADFSSGQSTSAAFSSTRMASAVETQLTNAVETQLASAVETQMTSAVETQMTSAVEILENECPEDIQLIATNGTTEYGDVPPIHILSQDQDTVTFQVHQNMFPGFVSYMYAHFHTVPNGDPGCLNATVIQSDTLTFTAGCMHKTPLSIVDLWVVDAALDADNDTATISDRCGLPEDIVLPTVQYTFVLHCVPQCAPISAPTEAPVIE
jgi:hypothetical protein